jgi:hypothetical protein
MKYKLKLIADSPYQQNYDLQFPNTLEPQSYLLTLLHSIVPYVSFNFENVFISFTARDKLHVLADIQRANCCHGQQFSVWVQYWSGK